MRSFAGLYFVVRLMLFLSNGIGFLLMISNNDLFFARNVILSATLLLVGLCRPYKKTHMIVLDVLLLALMGTLCHLVLSSESFTMQNRLVFCAGLMLCLPFVGIVVVFIVRARSSKNHQNLRFQKNQNVYSKDGMLSCCCKPQLIQHNHQLVPAVDQLYAHNNIEPNNHREAGINYGTFSYSNYNTVRVMFK